MRGSSGSDDLDSPITNATNHAAEKSPTVVLEMETDSALDDLSEITERPESSGNSKETIPENSAPTKYNDFGGDDSDDGCDDDDSDDDEIDWELHDDDGYASRDETKERVDEAIQASRNSSNVGNLRRISKNVVKFVHKHQRIIMVTALAFAFRKEIKDFLSKTLPKQSVDPETGKLLRRRGQLNATNLVKLLLFFHLLRRMTAFSSEDPKQLFAVATLLLKGVSSPVNLLLLPMILLPAKSSIYLPPVEQHYTFESLNNRFKKDGLALQKVLETSTTTLRRSPGRKSEKTVSLYKSILSSSQDEPKKYNSTTILLDMTRLDSSVSQIGSIRDKISFILSEHTKLDTNPESMSNSTLEVAVLVESPGGSAPDYALAAQQLLRLRNHPNITLTVL